MDSLSGTHHSPVLTLPSWVEAGVEGFLVQGPPPSGIFRQLTVFPSDLPEMPSCVPGDPCPLHKAPGECLRAPMALRGSSHLHPWRVQATLQLPRGSPRMFQLKLHTATSDPAAARSAWTPSLPQTALGLPGRLQTCQVPAFLKLHLGFLVPPDRFSKEWPCGYSLDPQEGDTGQGSQGPIHHRPEGTSFSRCWAVCPGPQGRKLLRPLLHQARLADRDLKCL